MADMHLQAPVNRVPMVVHERCNACQRCTARRVCRTKAIVQLDPGEPPIIDPSRCFGCMNCLQQCPAGAIIIP